MLSGSRDPAAGCTFLLDVDNTLFDNDGFAEDLGAHLEHHFGAAGRDRYFALYEALRDKVGYADYLGAVQLFRQEHLTAAASLELGAWMLDYRYAEHLYPGALDAIAHVQALGPTAILSDGDAVLQPHKIVRSGLHAALAGEVLVFIHKELMLDAVQQHYPAAHYVMVDDKPRVLVEMKERLGARLTTVFVRQGHYAAAVDARAKTALDLEIAAIGDLRHYDVGAFRRAAPVTRSGVR